MAGRLSCFEETLWSAKVAATSNLEVALKLFLEERIVKEHLSRISRKLGAATGGYEAEVIGGPLLVRILPQR
jgi:DNA-binding NarL/FixJ family response regulator